MCSPIYYLRAPIVTGRAPQHVVAELLKHIPLTKSRLYALLNGDYYSELASLGDALLYLYTIPYKDPIVRQAIDLAEHLLYHKKPPVHIYFEAYYRLYEVRHFIFQKQKEIMKCYPAY